MHLRNLYCFQYTAASSEELPKSAGWDFFKLDAEFVRQSVPNQKWVLCDLNDSYGLCDTCKFNHRKLAQIADQNYQSTTVYQHQNFFYSGCFFRSTTNLCASCSDQANLVGQLKVSVEGTSAGAHLFAFESGVHLSMQSAVVGLQCSVHGGRTATRSYPEYQSK